MRIWNHVGYLMSHDILLYKWLHITFVMVCNGGPRSHESTLPYCAEWKGTVERHGTSWDMGVFWSSGTW